MTKLVYPSGDINQKVYGDLERRMQAVEKRDTGGGGTPAGTMEALWWGAVPPLVTTIGPGVWSVPFIAGGSVTYTISRAYFRLETASTLGTYSVKFQKSAAGVFTPTDIVTVSLAAGANDVTVTGGFGVATVSSGDLLRIDWTGIGANALDYTLQLEAHE